jgi:hypothetical protein
VDENQKILIQSKCSEFDVLPATLLRISIMRHDGCVLGEQRAAF